MRNTDQQCDECGAFISINEYMSNAGVCHNCLNK